MGDLRLLLEHRPHQRRQLGVEVEDLLELVEDQRGAPSALGGELRRQLEQPLDRRVDVLGGRAPAAKLKRTAPSIGSTVIVGVIRRLRKISSARPARGGAAVAMSS